MLRFRDYETAPLFLLRFGQVYEEYMLSHRRHHHISRYKMKCVRHDDFKMLAVLVKRFGHFMPGFLRQEDIALHYIPFNIRLLRRYAIKSGLPHCATRRESEMGVFAARTYRPVSFLYLHRVLQYSARLSPACLGSSLSSPTGRRIPLPPTSIHHLRSRFYLIFAAD